MVNLIPWRRREMNEFGPLAEIRTDLDRLFGRLFESPFGSESLSPAMFQWSPSMEICDENDQLVISAELPGIDPNEIEVSVTGNQLTISGEKRDDSEQKREGFYRSERRYGFFRRSIELPPDVNLDQVQAEYDNGVLKLRVPKSEGKGTKRIPVSAGEGGKRQIGGTQRPRQERSSAEQSNQQDQGRTVPGQHGRSGHPGQAGQPQQRQSPGSGGATRSRSS